MLRGNIFKSCFLHYTCPPLFSSSASFSLSPSLSLSLSLSLSCGFFLDWVLADVKNDLVVCSFLIFREKLC